MLIKGIKLPFQFQPAYLLCQILDFTFSYAEKHNLNKSFSTYIARTD